MSECHSWNPPHCQDPDPPPGRHRPGRLAVLPGHQDTAWLRSRGWPLLKGIAEFWASRVTGNADGSYSIHERAGPDEYSNGVNDAVFTNAGAATALRNATRAAQVLGEHAPGSGRRSPASSASPSTTSKQVFVQYDGYKGTKIKQADTVLLMYPLEWPMPNEVAAGHARLLRRRSPTPTARP